MHFSKGLTFANKEAVKRALIIYVANDNRILLFGGQPKLSCALHALTPTVSGTLGHSRRLNLMVCGWSHLMWVHIVVYPLACEETVK